jgi:hypothetical protein
MTSVNVNASFALVARRAEGVQIRQLDRADPDPLSLTLFLRQQTNRPAEFSCAPGTGTHPESATSVHEQVRSGVVDERVEQGQQQHDKQRLIDGLAHLGSIEACARIHGLHTSICARIH